MNPLEAEFFEGQSREERGPGREGIDCRTKIVPEAGQSQFERASGAASNRLGLEDIDLEPRLSEHDGSGEPVGAGADDAGFVNLSSHLATRILFPRRQIGPFPDLDAAIRLPLQSRRIQ